MRAADPPCVSRGRRGEHRGGLISVYSLDGTVKGKDPKMIYGLLCLDVSLTDLNAFMAALHKASYRRIHIKTRLVSQQSLFFLYFLELICINATRIAVYFIYFILEMC